MIRRLALGAVIVVVLAAGALFLSLPCMHELKAAAPSRTSYQLLAGQAPAVSSPPLEQISPLLICAVVKAEDRTFFRHGGVVWARVREAALAELHGKHPSGGSTITQQLARNLYLSPDRSLLRKLRELLITLKLEIELPKQRLLELYLGAIEWGPGVWGIGQAAQHWLGKPAAALDAFDASFLAGLIAAPRAPLQGQNLIRLGHVQRRVLNQLYKSGLIDKSELELSFARATALAAALEAGRPLAEALPARPAPPPGQPLYSLILASGCGIEREMTHASK